MVLSVNLKLIIGFILAFTIVYVAIPTIIRAARITQWLDRPSDRKIHREPVPRLAGVAIFTGITIPLLLLIQCAELDGYNAILIAMIILFFIGLKDDILIIAPLTKFVGQSLAVLTVILYGGFKLTSFHGFFHIFQIPNWVAIAITLLTFLVIINAFNFIDGIDGLAATIAIQAAVAFGWWFYKYQIYTWSIVAAIIVGALLAYLRFNLSSGKNKIFFGDTGTMLIGLLIALLAVEFNQNTLKFDELRYFPAPAVSIGVLILPLYDMLRIIFIRVIIGKKIYEPDTNHIHHIFIKLGFSHKQTLVILNLINLTFVFLSFWLAKYFTIRRLLLILFILIALIIYIPSHILRKKEEKDE